MCYNVSKAHTSRYYLNQLVRTCNCDGTTFADMFELKRRRGALVIVIALRVENVFGYTLCESGQERLYPYLKPWKVHIGPVTLEDIFIDSPPVRDHRLTKRPRHYSVEMSICKDVTAGGTYRVMGSIFNKMVKVGLKSHITFSDNRFRHLPDYKPIHFSLYLASRLSNPSNAIAAKMMSQLLNDAVSSSQCIFKVR